MIDLKSAVKIQSEAAQLETVKLTDMIKHIKGDDFRLVEDAEGREYLHIVNKASKNYFSIKFGKKLNLTATTPAEKIKEVVNNYMIYAGVNEVEGAKRPWFTFGPAPTSREAVTVSIASLMGDLIVA